MFQNTQPHRASPLIFPVLFDEVGRDPRGQAEASTMLIRREKHADANGCSCHPHLRCSVTEIRGFEILGRSICDEPFCRIYTFSVG